jgi:predicted RNase H-like HicB family nuclease
VCYFNAMRFKVEIDRETDGRWIADIPSLPGVLTYGATRAEAVLKCQVLALRVIADRIEHGEEAATESLELTFDAA